MWADSIYTSQIKSKLKERCSLDAVVFMMLHVGPRAVFINHILFLSLFEQQTLPSPIAAAATIGMNMV